MVCGRKVEALSKWSSLIGYNAGLQACIICSNQLLLIFWIKPMWDALFLSLIKLSKLWLIYLLIKESRILLTKLEST